MESGVGFNSVLDTLASLRAANDSLVYLCDPVLGDHGKLYVPEELVAIYRDEVVPTATMLTPNQFEVELLTKRAIASEADAAAACESLHARGPHTVVITSLRLASEPNQVLMFASRHHAGVTRQWRLRLPALAQEFTGTGDLTAALLLAWSHQLDEPWRLGEVLEKVAASVQAVLQRTQRAGRSELCLVQSQREIVEPRVVLRAEELPSSVAMEPAA